MKTLTWPTTTSTTTTKLYAMAHHINLLNTPINNSKPRHGHATIEGGRSTSYPPYPPGRARVEWTRNHVRVRLWVRVWVLVRALNLGNPSVEWIMRHCSISVSVSLSALHFEWPLGHLGQNCLSYIKIKLSIQILNSLGNRRWNFMAR